MVKSPQQTENPLLNRYRIHWKTVQNENVLELVGVRNSACSRWAWGKLKHGEAVGMQSTGDEMLLRAVGSLGPCPLDHLEKRCGTYSEKSMRRWINSPSLTSTSTVSPS